MWCSFWNILFLCLFSWPWALRAKRQISILHLTDNKVVGISLQHKCVSIIHLGWWYSGLCARSFIFTLVASAFHATTSVVSDFALEWLTRILRFQLIAQATQSINQYFIFTPVHTKVILDKQTNKQTNKQTDNNTEVDFRVHAATTEVGFSVQPTLK